jgi:predicted DNA-binding transcriptional regulator AlpA
MLSETKHERLLTAKEVAERYGKIHPRTVPKLVELGKIPPPIKEKFGKGKVWREADIDEHIAKQAKES